MAQQNIQVGLEIKAGVSGENEIKQLTQAIASTSDETSELSKQAHQLSQEWQQAKQNTALIEHYKAIKKSLSDNRQEITQTEQQMRQLNAQMQNGATKAQEKEYEKLQNQLTRLNQQKRNLLNTLRDTNTQMNQVGVTTKNLTEKQKQFAEQANHAEKELKQLNQEAQKLERIAQNKATLGLNVDDHARQEIRELDKAFRDLKHSGKLTQAELARAAELHAQKVGEIEKSLQKVKPTLSDVAREIGGLVSQSGGLAYVANEAIKFESAMAQVKKVTDATPEQIAQLSGSLKDLAGELGMMPDELAKIAAAGGQMGMAFEKLPEFTKMTAQMANAFGMTADEAGDMSAKISNVYGLTIEQMGELGDAINTLGNTTAAKEAEIGNVLMRIGGNAKQFGLLKEEAAALSAAFVSLGKSPEEAGTAINAMLTKLQTSTEQTNEFKDSLKDIGLSAEEMAANIAANPQAALTDFLQRIEKLDKQSRSITLSKMFGAEYSDDLALLSGSLNTYEEALASAADRTKTFGAMQREAEAALNTTEGKMKQAKADIAAAAIELGNALLPAVQAAAVGLGSMADAVESVSAQFPVLSQIAVLLAAAKVASMAWGSAMKLAGVDGQTSFLKADVSAKKLKMSILETATAAKALGAHVKNAFTGNLDNFDANEKAAKSLGGQLASAAQNAVALYSAFEVGKGIGTALREQSEWVRNLGDNLGKGIAYLDAMFTDRTFEDVRKHYRTTNQELREQEKLQREAAKAANEKAAKEKQAAETQSQQIKQLNDKYRDLQDRYNGNETSLRALTAAGKENSAWANDLREKNKQLEQQLVATKAELGKMNAQISDVSPLAKNRQALSDLGLTAEQVATGISKSAQTALDDFALAAKGFGNDADSMAMIFQAAVKKMDSPEALAELKKSLTETGQNAGLTAEQINQIAQSAPQAGLNLAQISKPLGEAEKAATALGIELQNAFSGSSPAMQAALTNFTTLRGQLAELAAQGFDVGFIVQQSLLKMTETAQSKADIDSLKSAISSLEHTGVLSFNEIERAILSADMRLQEIKGTIDPTEAAFKKLGIQTKEAMRLSAEETRLAFESVKSSGQATSSDLKKAFEQTANDLLATGDSNQRAWVESQAAAYDYKVTVDSTGKAALQSAADTKAASDQKVAAHKQEAAAAEQAAQAQSQAQKQAKSDTEATTKAIKAQSIQLADTTITAGKWFKRTGGLIQDWYRVFYASVSLYKDIDTAMVQLNDSMTSGKNIAQALAKAEALAASHADVLGKKTLDKLRNAIDDAKNKMRELAEEARNARLETEKELLRAEGKDEEVAKLELQERINAMREKQKAAEAQGNKQAASDYEKAIANINRAAKAQREQQQREQQQREREQAQREEAERQREQEPNVAAVPVDVNVQTDVGDLINALKARDDLVANQAVDNLMTELKNALSQQR